jgi:glycosyltransferase involved in cell wall biosynthesis
MPIAIHQTSQQTPAIAGTSEGTGAGVSTTRILHVVGGMDRGGVETWLMHVLRSIDRGQFRMDFLSHSAQPCAYDDEVRALGGNIIPCLTPSRPWLYASNFGRIMRQHGPYDVVHSHVHHYSGYVLRLAHQAGVPIRIAHSHTSLAETNANLMRHAYTKLMRRWIDRHTTIGLAASDLAGSALFGPAWQQRRDRATLYCGVNLSPFHAPLDRDSLRAELGLCSDDLVVGHVGRFDTPKNHTFLIELTAELARREPRVRLLLVGDGQLRPAIEQQVERLGLRAYVRFAGARSDVPQVMRAAMDIFVMPSLHEGLPLVLMEAQAAGLRCVISDVITDEVDQVTPHVRRVSLADPPYVWAEHILRALYARPELAPTEALAIMNQSPFNIQASVEHLKAYYRA